MVSSGRRRSGSARRAAFWGVLAALLLLAACTILNPLDDYTNGIRSDAGLEASLDVRSDASIDAGCALRIPPERPTAGEGSGPLLRFAFDSMQPDRDGGPLGYDLDRQCTCQGGPTSCLNKAAPTAPACDLPEGVDNAGGALYKAIAAQAKSIAKYDIDPSGPIQRGRATLILQLADWNGTPNDSNVVLGLLYSFGTDGSQDAGDGFWSPEAGTIPPKRDGNDVWTYDPDSLPGGVPRIEDRAAYVRDGVLVGRFSSMALALGAVRFVIQDVIITGKLVPFAQGGTQLLEGVIQGRDSAEDILTQFQMFRSPNPPFDNLCRDEPIYAALRDNVCKELDIRKAPGDDNKGLPCDAVSLAFAYTAIPAKLGPPFPAPIQPTPCDDPDAGAAGKWVGRCP